MQHISRSRTKLNSQLLPSMQQTENSPQHYGSSGNIQEQNNKQQPFFLQKSQFKNSNSSINNSNKKPSNDPFLQQADQQLRNKQQNGLSIQNRQLTQQQISQFSISKTKKQNFDEMSDCSIGEQTNKQRNYPQLKNVLSEQNLRTLSDSNMAQKIGSMYVTDNQNNYNDFSKSINSKNLKLQQLNNITNNYSTFSEQYSSTPQPKSNLQLLKEINFQKQQKKQEKQNENDMSNMSQSSIMDRIDERNNKVLRKHRQVHSLIQNADKSIFCSDRKIELPQEDEKQNVVDKPSIFQRSRHKKSNTGMYLAPLSKGDSERSINSRDSSTDSKKSILKNRGDKSQKKIGKSVFFDPQSKLIDPKNGKESIVQTKKDKDQKPNFQKSFYGKNIFKNSKN